MRVGVINDRGDPHHNYAPANLDLAGDASPLVDMGAMRDAT